MKPCPHCGHPAETEIDASVFYGQIYSDRYPPKVAEQNHGFRVRCVMCGCQTCWWHYESEAIEAWDKRTEGQK
jgi:hypothetical protein